MPDLVCCWMHSLFVLHKYTTAWRRTLPLVRASACNRRVQATHKRTLCQEASMVAATPYNAQHSQVILVDMLFVSSYYTVSMMVHPGVQQAAVPCQAHCRAATYLPGHPSQGCMGDEAATDRWSRSRWHLVCAVNRPSPPETGHAHRCATSLLFTWRVLSRLAARLSEKRCCWASRREGRTAHGRCSFFFRDR